MSPWFWELQVCVRGNHKGSAWGGTGGGGGGRRKAHKDRVCAGDETRRERGRVLRKLRDRVPVSSWVWVSFVFGVMLRRHVASLEWELTWFSVKFVPYSMNYSILVWINLFLVWIRPIIGMNLQSLGVNCTFLVWTIPFWCDYMTMVWTTLDGVNHQKQSQTYIFGVNTNLWCEPIMLVWINKLNVNHTLWYEISC